MHIPGGIGNMGDLIKKTKVVPFLGDRGTTPNWTQIKKSTSFTLSYNPQTKTYDFISDEQPTEEIESYQPSLAQSLTMFKGEPDYQKIFDMAFDLPTGEDAHRPVLVVFYKEQGTTASTTVITYEKTEDETVDASKTYYTKEGDVYTEVAEPSDLDIDSYYEKITTVVPGGTVYKAWKVDSLVKLNQMDTVNENIDFDLAFNEIERGAVEIGSGGTPTFIKGTFDDGTFTPDSE